MTEPGVAGRRWRNIVIIVSPCNELSLPVGAKRERVKDKG